MKRFCALLPVLLIAVTAALAAAPKGRSFPDRLDRIYRVVSTAHTRLAGVRSKLMVPAPGGDSTRYTAAQGMRLPYAEREDYDWSPEQGRWGYLAYFGEFAPNAQDRLEKQKTAILTFLDQWMKMRGFRPQAFAGGEQGIKTSIYSYQDDQTHTELELFTERNANTEAISLYLVIREL